MGHKTFQEYLDHKNKLQNTGKVQRVADYNGPSASKPGKEKKHKDAGGKGQTGEPKPYAGGTNAKDPNKGKNTDGFAGKGDKKLEYKPGKGELGKGAAGVPGGSAVKGWPKVKTQEWIDRTKGLTLAEFTKQIQKTTTKGVLEECACQGGVLESVKTTADLAKVNKSVVSALVREMKRNKTFGKLVAEMLQHRETYGVIARFMENDERYARRLVRAMNEIVAPPAHNDNGEEEDDMRKPPHPAEMEGSDDEMDMDMDMGGDEMGMDDEMGGMGDDEMGGEMGMDDEMGGGMGDDMGMGGMSPHGPHGDPGSDIAPHSKIMPAKKKRRPHAHHHLMNAMKDHPAMAGDMGSPTGM